MKKKLLFVLLVAVLIVAGCAYKNRNSEPDSEPNPNNVVSENPPVVTEEETENVENVESVENVQNVGNTDSIIINSASGDIALRQEYKYYYEQFYPLLKNYANISHPEALLMNMNEIYSKNYSNYCNAIAHETSDLENTAHSNYIQQNNEILKYDPFCAAFYSANPKLNINPILVAEMIDKNYTYGKRHSTEYLPFNYNFMPVNINKDFSVPQKAIAEIVGEYFGINAENLIVAYSPEEKLFYTYIINSNGAENSFTISTLFFDVQNGEVKRIGVETYVRTHSEINAYFNDNTVPSADNACLIDCLNTPYNSSPYAQNNLTEPISENFIAKEHKDFCDMAGSIMMNSNFTQKHSVKFDFLDDFHNAMNCHDHFFANHYVSWFTKE